MVCHQIFLHSLMNLPANNLGLALCPKLKFGCPIKEIEAKGIFLGFKLFTSPIVNGFVTFDK